MPRTRKPRKHVFWDRFIIGSEKVGKRFKPFCYDRFKKLQPSLSWPFDHATEKEVLCIAMELAKEIAIPEIWDGKSEFVDLN